MSKITHSTILEFEQVASMRSVGEGAVILLADSGQLYTCNETSETILRDMSKQRSIGDMVDLLCEEFDITKETATTDVIEIAENLIEEGILRIV
ncbi:MAG: PqqD family protein [Hyphomicrobiales bacterium]